MPGEPCSALTVKTVQSADLGSVRAPLRQLHLITELCSESQVTGGPYLAILPGASGKTHLGPRSAQPLCDPESLPFLFKP